MILAFDGSGEPGEFSFLFLPLRLIESQGTQKSVGCPIWPSRRNTFKFSSDIGFTFT